MDVRDLVNDMWLACDTAKGALKEALKIAEDGKIPLETLKENLALIENDMAMIRLKYTVMA